jgi:hypothetical protein
LTRESGWHQTASSAEQSAIFAFSWLEPIAAVEYLEAGPAFPSNHGLVMAIAQLDLTNRPARCVDLPKNYRRGARRASRCSARRRVAASPDLNSRRRRIEVRFEHCLVSITRSRTDAALLCAMMKWLILGLSRLLGKGSAILEGDPGGQLASIGLKMPCIGLEHNGRIAQLVDYPELLGTMMFPSDSRKRSDFVLQPVEAVRKEPPQ